MGENQTATASPMGLLFEPVRNSQPKSLSSAQIEQFNSEGYAQPFDVFSNTEIAAIRSYIDGLMTAMGPIEADGTSLSTPLSRFKIKSILMEV